MDGFGKIEEHVPEYWEGGKNILIRVWTYIKVACNQADDLKYVAASIFGVYLLIKLNNIIWLIVMFVASLPLLAILGRWWLYKGAKTSEFVTATKGSVIGYRSYNLQVRQVELLEQILAKLNEKRSSQTKDPAKSETLESQSEEK